ncbi:MAG: DUF5107 domain-containing protein [Clostridia bacterium]|nr:DUF5107 domain-containing protein [Clostridia bacterium]
MKNVIVREEKVLIPTYEIAQYDKNPMFLEKRVYQGSSGKVYPHPVCEGVSDVKQDKEYNAIILENDYIMVMILPEIGGRIQRFYDKTNGYDAVYYNEVIKPALVGLAGPWLSGGIEFNWPQHHRPSTFDAVDYTVEKNQDGSITVWVGEVEKMFHTKGMAGFTVHPDKAYLEIKGQVYNPTERTQTFLWWANPAVAVNDYTQSIFPPDVHAVMDHGKRDVSKFPIADGVYYKYDYAPGTDISRYKNIPVPTSYMAYHSDFDFIGNYDYEKKAGLLHIADHHVSPGKKQWTWGNGDFGKAWDRNLTDENGPYIELMTGMFTDNQPDFTFLKPYEEKSFVQYFMPYKCAGAVKNASVNAVLNVEIENGRINITVYAPEKIENAIVEVCYSGAPLHNCELNVKTAEVFACSVPFEGCSEDVSVSIKKDGKTIVDYIPVKNKEEIPSPAEAIPAPEKIETNEKLFLAAVHLEQYRHATYSPEAYYLEGLKRDCEDIRINNGYGKYLYNKGRFNESIEYFRRAIKASTWKNPNPYDCEPYYNLGLALRKTGDMSGAFDAFYKAIWDGNMQDKAYYQLSCIACYKKDYALALDFVEKALSRGTHNLKARGLKVALLRIMNKTEEAVAFAKETIRLDALDHHGRYELYALTGEGCDEWLKIMRGDNHNFIELALTYIEAGITSEADKILSFAHCDEPMVHYYRFLCTGDALELKKAEESSSLYCFPNRIEDITVLSHAMENGGYYAAYYLGCLYYDRGVWEKSVELWEACNDKITLATVYRNLSLAYYNKLNNADKAKEYMEKAFLMDQTDARVFFELDQLYKILNASPKKRLEKMLEYSSLIRKRDDLFTEYITLLNLLGRHKEAYESIMSHSFHPWEGGEGKVPAQYRQSLINLAKEDAACAEELLKKALIYPHNLGEGKLIGNLDNDIYYMLGKLTGDENYYSLAARGNFELSSAMYYNDQPPEMMYYAALAIKALGNEKNAEKRFDAFIEYADMHMDDDIKIDYFAVSLPEFLIFEADLNKKNKIHCLYMKALGYLGKGNKEKAKEYAQMGLDMEKCHAGFADILKGADNESI